LTLTLGYTKNENKKLVIAPEEAEIVKRIYREYLEGASFLQIGRGLEVDGILTAAGNKKWIASTLQKILRNEKYIGDALLQKTYTVDFLSKKRVTNNGIVPQYYVENSHEPIIPREIFMQVQEEMVRRANLNAGKARKREFTAVSMHSPVSFTVVSAVKFTAVLIGTIEVSEGLFGDAHPDLRKKDWNAIQAL